MKHSSHNAIEQLNRELSLGATGDEQDWEIQLADPDRLKDFIAKYHVSNRNPEMDFALVGLLIASFDAIVCERMDALNLEYVEIFQSKHFELEKIYTQGELDFFDSIKAILQSDLALYAERIKYWSCLCEFSDGEPFATTPLFQNMLMQTLKSF